ncbi:MAG: ketopantoate reductase family protein [Sphingomonadaceae bacterium]|nr:ketopantoate reductase family protein [Sphingomonadaceae bacterium]
MTKILVIGAGAVGSWFAGQFHRAGYHVTLLARGARLQGLRNEGLLAEQDGAALALPVSACDWDSLPDTADFTLLALKTYQLEDALDSLASAAPAVRSALVTLQNGIDAPDQCRRHFPDAHVIAARMHGFVQMEGPLVRHVGVPVSLAFGPWRSEEQGPSEAFATLLRSAAIGAMPAADIEAQLWEKFLLAASSGSTGAALGIRAGQLLDDVVGAVLLAEAMGDVARLAQHRGIAMPQDVVAHTLAFMRSFPPDATTSLQRDLDAGRPSEYGALTGAVLRIAAESGVEAPAFERIEALIRSRGISPA